jgi:ferric enterobactin receptor
MAVRATCTPVTLRTPTPMRWYRATTAKRPTVSIVETFGLHHRGGWDNGVSTNNYVQFERTRNSRLNEGLAGGTEGIFDAKNEGFGTTKLDDFLAHSEVSVPFELGVIPQTATLGTEWNQQRMKDGSSTSQTMLGGTIPGQGRR